MNKIISEIFLREYKMIITGKRYLKDIVKKTKQNNKHILYRESTSKWRDRKVYLICPDGRIIESANPESLAYATANEHIAINLEKGLETLSDNIKGANEHRTRYPFVAEEMKEFIDTYRKYAPTRGINLRA